MVRAASRKIIDAARLCRAFARAVDRQRSTEERHPPNIAAFEEAWFSSDGGGSSIGLVDGSVDRRSPDLVGADIVTRDFVGRADECADTAIHGTNMATLLVGQGNEYMQGVVPRARLLAARVVGPTDMATPDRIAAGIDWLVLEGVRVVALPLGSEIDSTIVASALVRGSNAGVRFFAASGNGSGAVLFPARHPCVIAVGPADERGTLLPQARRDPHLDLLAPGWQIPGLLTTNGRGSGSGSSIACVMATGMAALQPEER
jgi:hypothetical protein